MSLALCEVALAACGGDPLPPSATTPDLVINEIMADNAITLEGGRDWVELYNPTDAPISLEGCSLTDDFGKPRKQLLGDEVVPPHGHVVVFVDGLAREGGELGLAGQSGAWIDRVRYGAQAVDLAAARVPDGSGAWRVEWHATPGEPNPAGEDRPAPGGDAMEEVPEAGDVSERILGDDVLPALEIQISPEGVSSLMADPRRYVRATLVFDGRAYGPVGVRLKGRNSFLPFDQKPSFRINVDEYVPGAKFFGLDDLTLNNMSDDFSMMHERLAYRVARQAGIPASRANHALVTVNGQSYGLYANLESVKQQMIARWFDDPAGPLFEGTDADLAPEYVGEFEHEAGPDDRTLLEETAAALTMASPDEALARAGQFADLPEFRRYWAFCAVIGQFDALPYSDPGDDYLVYADPESDRLWFMPWGMDEAFYSSNTDVSVVRSVLAARCKESSVCMQDFVAEVWDVLAMTEAQDLAGERTRVAAQILPHVMADSRKPYTTETVLEYQEHLRRFISGRRAKLTAMLP